MFVWGPRAGPAARGAQPENSPSVSLSLVILQPWTENYIIEDVSGRFGGLLVQAALGKSSTLEVLRSQTRIFRDLFEVLRCKTIPRAVIPLGFSVWMVLEGGDIL